MIAEGKFPNFQKLVQKGTLRRMNSVIPCISSVAWTSFMTGTNPAKHNIQGFVDRKPNPFKIFIPLATDIAVPTISEMLSRAGKRVVSINLPVSYPPKQVNGVQISCFLATNLSKAVYPAELVPEIKQLGYRIDVDAKLARNQRYDEFLKDLHYAYDQRVKTARYLMEKQDWDYFHLHIMETDRINHFLWEQWENGHPHFAPEFEKFYQKVDQFIGELDSSLPDEIDLMILSDHGFCTLKKEVYLNYWLEKNGYLRYKSEKPQAITDIHPDSKAFSLLPGRIFINLKGREEFGSVAPGQEYENLRNELIGKLPSLLDPDSGERIIRKIVKRETLFNGPHFETTPDLLVIPENGYDLKGNILEEKLTAKGTLVGMHTDDDATFFLRNRLINKDDNTFGIIDILPTIMKLLDLNVPEASQFDGKSIL
jgi:predicted AlkP superfamily phosphohydrolase/phosphomutase